MSTQISLERWITITFMHVANSFGTCRSLMCWPHALLCTHKHTLQANLKGQANKVVIIWSGRLEKILCQNRSSRTAFSVYCLINVDMQWHTVCALSEKIINVWLQSRYRSAIYSVQSLFWSFAFIHLVLCLFADHMILGAFNWFFPCSYLSACLVPIFFKLLSCCRDMFCQHYL